MPIQAYADESGGAGHSRHFVMAALVSESESWAIFSDEWRACLAEHPAIRRFKMSEAANLSGEFFRVSAEERDAKLIALAAIINRYARFVTYSTIDIDAHAKTWGANLEKPLSESYFFPFHNTIMAICFDLWRIGSRERFEIIFDENVIFGPRAKIWYPVIRDCVQRLHPQEASIMPVDPIFRTDDEFLPLQAADFYAWCFRMGQSSPEKKLFEWLLPHLRSVKLSGYSQYYDQERMELVYSDSHGIPHSAMPSQEIIETYKKLVGW